MNAHAIQLILIMIVVATFRDNDAAAQRGSKTYGHQHQRKESFHNVRPLAVVKALYLECRLPVCLCVTRRVI
jgi:hypothetical protein